MPDRPIVTTLCGSTRFPDAFDLANMHLSMRGRLVISVGLKGHAWVKGKVVNSEALRPVVDRPQA